MLIEKVAPMWLICLAIMAVLLLTLCLLVRISGGRKRQRIVWGLHGDQQGSVQSLSFVLTLPVFIMIIMAVVQIGQIMMAQVVVEYAALASARAASVWTSTFTKRGENYSDSHVSQIEQQRNCLGDRREPIGTEAKVAKYRIVTSDKKHTKVGQIEKAAHMACLPICPSRWPYLGEPMLSDTDTIDTHASLVKAYNQMAGEHSSASEQAISDRLKKKYAYSKKNTTVKIEIDHPLQSEPSLDQVYQWGYQVNRVYVQTYPDLDTRRLVLALPACDLFCCDIIPYASEYAGDALPYLNPPIQGDKCDYLIEFTADDQFGESLNYKKNQIGWQDRITITVTHHLALLPGPGKILSRMIHGDAATRSLGDTVEQQAGDSRAADGILYTWPLVAKASTINEGELSTLRYEYRFKD